MGKFDAFTEKWKTAGAGFSSGLQTAGTVYSKIRYVIGILILCLYRLRAVFLAIPVAYCALKLAAYNNEHLPELVGINLMASGAFSSFISREMAVAAPLVVTGACLALMIVSRKALYPWAVSIFTLILPVLLLVSNSYPM